MKIEKKNESDRAGLCRPRHPVNQGTRLAEAGYPRFLFRIAAARRVFGEIAAAPRRRD
jgi:hypothetical protein